MSEDILSDKYHTTLKSGKTLSFDRLSIGKLKELQGYFNAIEEKVARDIAKEFEMSKAELINAIKIIRSRPLDVAELYARAATPEGMEKILELAAVSPEVKKDIANLSNFDLTTLCQNLIANTHEEDKKEEDKDKSKNA